MPSPVLATELLIDESEPHFPGELPPWTLVADATTDMDAWRWVLRESRRCGIGQRLLAQGEAEIVGRGHRTEPYDSLELRCFERNQAAGPGIIRAVNRLAADIKPARSPPQHFPARSPIPLLRSLRLQRVLIPSGQMMLPAFYLASPRAKGVLVAVDDRGKEELASDPVVREATAQGWSICGVDPRGIGESATTMRTRAED